MGRSDFGGRGLASEPLVFLGLLGAVGLDAHVDHPQFEPVVRAGEDLLTDLGELLLVLDLEALAAEGLSHELVLGVGVEVSDTVSIRLTLQGFSSAVDSVVVDDEDDTPQFVAGQGLALQSAESEGAVSHDGHTPEFRVATAGRGQGCQSNSHGSEGSGIEFASGLFVLEDSPADVHGVGALSDQNGLSRHELLDHIVGRVVGHGDDRIRHQVLVELLVLVALLSQFLDPVGTPDFALDGLVEFAHCQFHISHQSCLCFHVVPDLLGADVDLDHLDFLVEARRLAEVKNPVETGSQKNDEVSFLEGC